jgi:iron-sulfur cluster assembly accessory protein
MHKVRLSCEKRALDFCCGGPEIHLMTTPHLTVTPAAAQRILKITGGDASAALRLAVNGGGCSGFQYEFDIVKSREAEDLAFERDGATVLVDTVSMLYVNGSVLDFEDSLMGQAFKVSNPQAKSSCGCGTSFSL